TFVLGYINLLRMMDKREEAYQEATSLVQKRSDFCEARATLAALTFERGDLRAARQLVKPALDAGAAPDTGPSTLRCAVISPAAIGDARGAAASLRRIARDERLLRMWAIEVVGTTGSKLLERPMFPWTRVYDRPEFVEGRRAIADAYDPVRRKI